MISTRLRVLLLLALMLVIDQTRAAAIEVGTDTACTEDALEEIFSSKERIKKWVDQSNYRGTFDILWTCLASIFISTYSMLCLNVPAPTDTVARRTGRRLLWMALGILGPEFPLTYAAGQWSRAKQSVQAFRKSGYEG